MVYLMIMISIILGILGIIIGINYYKKYEKIMHSTEKVTIDQIIKIAALLGIAASCFFFGFIMTMGTVVEKELNWTFQGYIGVISLSGAIGLISFLGSIYQIFTSVLYRNLLIKNKDWLIEKGTKKKE